MKLSALLASASFVVSTVAAYHYAGVILDKDVSARSVSGPGVNKASELGFPYARSNDDSQSLRPRGWTREKAKKDMSSLKQQRGQFKLQRGEARTKEVLMGRRISDLKTAVSPTRLQRHRLMNSPLRHRLPNSPEEVKLMEAKKAAKEAVSTQHMADDALKENAKQLIDTSQQLRIARILENTREKGPLPALPIELVEKIMSNRQRNAGISEARTHLPVG